MTFIITDRDKEIVAELNGHSGKKRLFIVLDGGSQVVRGRGKSMKTIAIDPNQDWIFCNEYHKQCIQ